MWTIETEPDYKVSGSEVFGCTRSRCTTYSCIIDDTPCKIEVDDSTHRYGCDYDEYQNVYLTYGPYKGNATYGPYTTFQGSVECDSQKMCIKKEPNEKRVYRRNFNRVDCDDTFTELLNIYRFFKDFVTEYDDDEKPVPPAIK